MGCANSKDVRKGSGQATEVVQQMQGNASQQAVPEKKAGNGVEGAATAVEEDDPSKLNVMGAEKMNLEDLVEKESFHDVYTLGETLGRGNYSVVRKGTRKGTEDVFAIKCIKEANLTHEDREALKIETAILKGMHSPHIIKLYGFYEEKKEKMYYIVTEFVSGGELFDRIIAKEYYSEEDAQKLVRTIAQAIQYCHARGVVHRDLKPENILLTSKEDDDSIKIADFGFAKQYDTSSDDALSTSCGTPGYVAPEILNGKKYGKEVDMWSLGVIIYILLCGYPPFHHENQKELFRQIRKGEFQFDEEYWGEVSQSAKDLIKKLLVVDGSKRMTVDELLEHEWLNTKVTTNLTDIQPKIQAMINKRRLKAGITAVMANNRLAKAAGLATAIKQGAEKEAAAEATPVTASTDATPAKVETDAPPAPAPAPAADAPADAPAPAAVAQQ